mgnify:CR=1 FL=1
MNPDPQSPIRALIGAGNLADARAAIQLLERLSDLRFSEFGGLYLEDSLLTDLARLPSQRLVTVGGMLADRPSHHMLRRISQADAAAFRDMLGRIARDREWSFQHRRGKLIHSLLAAAKGWDMVIVGQRMVGGFRGPVVVVAPRAGAPGRAMALAEGLARRVGTGVRTLSLERATAGRPAAHPGLEYFVNEQALLAHLARLPAAGVIVDLAADEAWPPDRLNDLYDAARCSILLLNG